MKFPMHTLLGHVVFIIDRWSGLSWKKKGTVKIGTADNMQSSYILKSPGIFASKSTQYLRTVKFTNV